MTPATEPSRVPSNLPNIASQISAVRAAIDLDVSTLDRAQTTRLARLQSDPSYKANMGAKQAASDLTRSIAQGDASGDLASASHNLGQLTQAVSDQKLAALAADPAVVAARAAAMTDEKKLVALLEQQGIAIAAASTAEMNSTSPPPVSTLANGGANSGVSGWGNGGGGTYVQSYFRKDGTYVRGYYRR